MVAEESRGETASGGLWRCGNIVASRSTIPAGFRKRRTVAALQFEVGTVRVQFHGGDVDAFFSGRIDVVETSGDQALHFLYRVGDRLPAGNEAMLADVPHGSGALLAASGPRLTPVFVLSPDHAASLRRWWVAGPVGL